jgi:tripartite-type tricarboxylate transporter receptor subunit TctC
MKRRVAGISERDVMKLPRRQFLHLASAAALALTFDPSQGQAQEWPARPVTMVVPTAAGGGADILGRILAGRLSEILGQPVIIEDVGNAVAATNRIAKGMTDGYHFTLGGTAHLAFHPTIYKTPVYNSRTDFAPVALVVEQPFLLVTRLDFPANNLQEFSAFTRANQSKLQYGSGAGAGSGNHLSCEMLNSAIGVKVTHVPYRDIGPLTQDMIAGRIDYQCPLPGTMIPLIQNDKVKGIATLGKGRLAVLPNLASAEEQGLTDFEAPNWYGLFMPKGTPEPIIRKLNQAIIATLDTLSVEQRLAALGATVVAPERRSPEYLQKFVVSEIEKWAVPIKAAGVLIE